MTTTPAQRIERIRARLDARYTSIHENTGYSLDVVVDAGAMRDDIAWLLARLAAAEAVAQRAEAIPEQVTYFDEDLMICHSCETFTPVRWEAGRMMETPAPEYRHTADCPWVALQAALDAWRAGEGE